MTACGLRVRIFTLLWPWRAHRRPSATPRLSSSFQNYATKPLAKMPRRDEWLGIQPPRDGVVMARHCLRRGRVSNVQRRRRRNSRRGNGGSIDATAKVMPGLTEAWARCEVATTRRASASTGTLLRPAIVISSCAATSWLTSNLPISTLVARGTALRFVKSSSITPIPRAFGPRDLDGDCRAATVSRLTETGNRMEHLTDSY
jgi:hypothetical protein